jgi:hypothetical protein
MNQSYSSHTCSINLKIFQDTQEIINKSTNTEREREREREKKRKKKKKRRRRKRLYSYNLK